MTLVERLRARLAAPPGRAEADAARRFPLPANVELIRFGAVLLFLPDALFAITLRFMPAIAVLGGCLLAWVILWRSPPRKDDSLLAAPIDAATLLGCAALALALCLLGGETHVFFANFDWLTRDSVLSDLVNHGMIDFYRVEDRDYVLRAPLGMYLTPAMVGRLFGLHAAHLALLAQNAALVAIILYFVALISPGRKIIALLIFTAFSGLDILPALVVNLGRWWQTHQFTFDRQLEWWNGAIQYSSHITLLFWVPNHMTPGWWFALLALLYVRREIDLASLVASFAPLLLWSPLAMLGAAPFLVLFGVEQLPVKIFTTRFFAAAASGLAFLPVAIYLTLDAGEVSHGFLLLLPGFVALWALFLIVEIPHAAIVALQRRLIPASDQRILALAIVALVFIPIYSLGPNDDFAMRASIMPLFLLAFAFTRVAMLTPRDNGLMATAISVIVLVSAETPIAEIIRSFSPAFAISDCNLLTASERGGGGSLPTNYLAPVSAVPAWLIATDGPRLTVEPRKCWPDHPFLKEK